MMSSFKRASPPGFTLIELLVVLFIIGLVSSLVFLSVGRGIFTSQKKGVVRAFGEKLTMARSKSLGTGRIVQFFIYGEERAFGIEGGEKEPFPKSVQVEGKGVADYSEGIYAITFYPDGSSSGGTITISWPDGTAYRLTVGRFFGVIKVKKLEGMS